MSKAAPIALIVILLFSIIGYMAIEVTNDSDTDDDTELFVCDNGDEISADLQNNGFEDCSDSSASIYNQEDFATVTPQELRRFSSIHLDAPFFITQGLTPKLKDKNGCVIGMVDTSWDHAWEELAHYTATKAALRQLLINLAGELAPEIRVNGIAPGAILAAAWEKDRFEKILEKVPLRRAGTPEDIAEAVKFLADASYITGFILPVDGGWSLT